MNIGYNVLKYGIKYSLYLYFAKIQLKGTENIPTEHPVLFLPNHQNALIDVLLIAVSCKRKPYFLTRSDVFRNPWLNRFFSYLQMLPVYRIRDGRDTIKQNEEIFARCAKLLTKGAAIVLFPEANHNLKRRVRPLSNGFMRILSMAEAQAPGLDIRIVPVGLNYCNAPDFPDRVAIHYGSNITVGKLFDANDLVASTQRVKMAVKGQLKELTTHIEDLREYDKMVARLKVLGVDYLKPKEVNAAIANIDDGVRVSTDSKKRRKGIRAPIFSSIFGLLNLPIVICWRFWLKQKVWEPEFMATFRFGYALFSVPVYYLFLILVLSWAIDLKTAFIMVVCHFLFNWVYVKFA